MARSGSETSVSFVWARRLPGTTWRLLTQTVGTCLRYRVTGLAAEAAFFAILSLPPLIFGLAGSIGFIANQFNLETIEDVKIQIIQLAERALTADSVQQVIVPTLDDVLGSGGRFDVISIGFLLALWSGSRALNVFVDTITIMYGMGGRRGIVKTRALSFTLYCVALIIGVIVLPLVLAGPSAVDALLPARVDFLNQLYWPVVTILSAGFLNTLYHLSVPVRTPWVSDLPGSFLALSLWILGSFLLRWTLQTTVGGTSIYGPLAAPIAVLLWLYLTAIAVLIGAALNAVVDRMWPHKARKDAADLSEPVMKADSKAHHEEDQAPDDERPEVKMAKAIEALGQPKPQQPDTPATPTDPPPVDTSPKPPPASTSPQSPRVETSPAVTPPKTTTSSDRAAAPASGPANSVGGAPATPATTTPATPAPAPAEPSASPGEERRTPTPVGKPGAPPDPDDLR
ncbi:YhjD/YihY/BrkB family envelope integrity protein [Kribbella sp. CA-293567]|uniref:YhjD/YihY/BrkB family envelope integrity protein n=1 Tax=Kribbella sp. CA-293567 TaxID=3002436 RepID=UPI0022DD912C|nr:YhjD/YihY/BrkB family envelope integrity protein [Kribbella sp. CA-293567]WBQ01846.1 YihY/virulence factor BrkB family protein [Kribbella sp. CA-293567]